MVLAPYDRDELRARFRSEEFAHVLIDGFLDPGIARRAAGSFLPFEQALPLGRSFQRVNENLKVQIVDRDHFPAPIQAIQDAIADPSFIHDLEHITGIPNLIWDPGMVGGGMHQTARSGWLDVHADFNFHEQLGLHRRLNLIVYLNPTWSPKWGGELELWDPEVRRCIRSITPSLNRCVIFSTTRTSFHGVTAVHCPTGVQRQSFAAYYYTREAPEGWDGQYHSTLFRARPKELAKRYFFMPGELAWDKAKPTWEKVQREGVRKTVRAGAQKGWRRIRSLGR